MKLIPVALAVFHRKGKKGEMEVWVQRREDDGIYHGLLEFPGGGIEPGEAPLAAAVREVEEEVGIRVDAATGSFMGTYNNEFSNRNVLLYVFLFPDQPGLAGKGQWLSVTSEGMSSPYLGQIPGPNHRIIDELFLSLYDVGHV